MKTTKKSNSFIALVLLATTFTNYSMKRNPQTTMENVIGDILLNDTPITLKTFPFADLSNDLKNEIIYLLVATTTAQSFEVAATALSALAQVNTQLNELINNPAFCLQLIKHLARKFNCADQKVAENFSIEQAKKQLTLQNKLLDLCQEKNPNPTILNNLLEQGIDLDFTYYIDDYNKMKTPLMISLMKESPLALLLLQKGANANFIDENGNTMLMLAIKYRQNAIAKKLIGDYNAFLINHKNNHGETALSLATHDTNNYGQYDQELIKNLLDAGADPEILSNYNGMELTPLAYMEKMLKVQMDLLSDEFFSAFNPTQQDRQGSDDKTNTLKEIINRMQNAIAKKHEKSRKI